MAALVRVVLSGETYNRFCTWPAAQRHHGAVRHGLLAHSLRVSDLAIRIASAYPPDQLTYDRSLVVAAALLHDIGKVRTLPAIAGAVVPEAVTHFDHVTLGILIVQQAVANLDPPLEPARLDALLHIILAHHARPEWGATVEPKTTEAWLVHVADLAEARLWAYSNQADTPQPAPAHP
jgi:3'-5' exoribonuclease